MQIKNSSQQSYITRLNVEISKLKRNLYQASAAEIQGTGKVNFRSLSRIVKRNKHLLRSISNSSVERRNANDKITCSGFSANYRHAYE